MLPHSIIAKEICENYSEDDIKHAFILSFALGKNYFTHFKNMNHGPLAKQEYLQSGDVLLKKVYFQNYKNDQPFDFHIFWAQIVKINKHGIFVKNIEAKKTHIDDLLIQTTPKLPDIETKSYYRIGVDSRKCKRKDEIYPASKYGLNFIYKWYPLDTPAVTIKIQKF
jgi:hypothetical protein